MSTQYHTVSERHSQGRSASSPALGSLRLTCILKTRQTEQARVGEPCKCQSCWPGLGTAHCASCLSSRPTKGPEGCLKPSSDSPARSFSLSARGRTLYPPHLHPLSAWKGLCRQIREEGRVIHGQRTVSSTASAGTDLWWLCPRWPAAPGPTGCSPCAYHPMWTTPGGLGRGREAGDQESVAASFSGRLGGLAWD